MPSNQSDIQSRDFNTDRTNEINVIHDSIMHIIGPYSSQTSAPSTSNEGRSPNLLLQQKVYILQTLMLVFALQI